MQTDDTLQQLIRRELPGLLRQDPEFRTYVREISQQVCADKAETEDRFTILLNELRRDREASNRKWDECMARMDREHAEQKLKWDEHNRHIDAFQKEQAEKWDQQNRKWDEHNRRFDAFQKEQAEKWDQQNRKWDEHNRRFDAFQKEQAEKWDQHNRHIDAFQKEQAEKWDQQNRKWDEHNRRFDAFQKEQAEKWDQQNRKWNEHNRHIDAFQKEQAEKWDQQNRKWEEQNRKWDENQKEIRELTKKLDRSIGALGARWGMQSEASFRNALAGILEGNFAVQVINYTDYDDSGEVFGRPEQVELDIIIQNGKLLICELKSSIDRGGMYLFERKARFYEKKHQCKADKLIVISPMISSKAENVAKQLGIMTYSDSDDVKSL